MSRVKTVLRKGIVAPAFSLCFVLFLAACSGNTQYHLFIDALSFIEQQSRAGTATPPTSSGLTAYLLPLFEFFEDAAIPPVAVKRGIGVDLPQRNTPEEVRLILGAVLVLELSNLSDAAPLPALTVSLFLAPFDCDDLYTEGIPAASLDVLETPPSSRTLIDFRPLLRQGDDGYEILASGRFRLGIRIQIPATVGLSLQFGYELQELNVTVSGYPFGLIP